MSNKPLPIELAQSQVHFASNLENGTTRRSDYLKANFQITKDRENQVFERELNTHVKSSTLNLDDYYAGLKANDQFDSQGNGNLFLKEVSKGNKLTFILHCLLLLAAIICGSSIGIFYYDIQPESQILKASWRMLFLAICMSPVAIYEYVKGKETYFYSREVLWNKNTWKGIFWASIGRVVWAIALIISVNHTSIAQANLFINVHPILLMLFKMRARPSLLQQEKIGGIFVIAGIILVLLDNQLGSASGFVDLNNIENSRRIFSGNMVALIGSIGGALYFTKDQQLKNEFPFFLFTVLVSLIGFVLTSGISLIFENATISFNPENGIFGVFTGERIGIYILLILVTGFGTYFGYGVSSKYFQPLFLSLALNTEPIFAMLLVSILGWQTFPALLTIIAFCLFIPGTMMVTLGNKEVEVMEYDILDDGTGSYGQTSFIEPRLARATSMVRQYKMSSAVAPISWER